MDSPRIALIHLMNGPGTCRVLAPQSGLYAVAAGRQGLLTLIPGPSPGNTTMGPSYLGLPPFGIEAPAAALGMATGPKQWHD